MPKGYEETPEPGIISFDDDGYYMEVVDPGEGKTPTQVLPSHEIPPPWYAGDSEARERGDCAMGSRT